MYRSSSVSPSAEGGFALVLNSNSVSPPAGKGSTIKKSYSAVAVDLLPRYGKWTDDREKKQSRVRPEHAVHLIPVVIVLCALVLWLAGGVPHEDFAEFNLMKHIETTTTKNNKLIIGEGLKHEETTMAKNTNLVIDEGFKHEEIVMTHTDNLVVSKGLKETKELIEKKPSNASEQ